MTTVFESMSSRKMAGLIRRAKTRVVVAAPALHDETAQALVEFSKVNDGANVEVVIDCDDEVLRLGYGDMKAITRLNNAGIPLRQSTGLRVGVLIVDDEGWLFTPTALYVQAEVHSDETPNALRLSPQEAERVVQRLSVRANEEARADHGTSSPRDGQAEARADHEALSSEDRQEEEARADHEALGSERRQKEEAPSIEVGLSEVSSQRISSVSRDLEQVPPVPFDVTRQVRVFQPYIQYVDISLRGCAIQRKKVNLPASIMDMGAESQVRDRLKTTFDLIERGSAVSSKGLEDELRKIRDAYTRPLGKPWGRVLLRAKRKAFDKAIEEFRTKVSEHEQKVKKELQEHLQKSLGQVTDYYQPIVVENPPALLRGQIMTAKPTEEQAKEWLEYELSRVFPEPDKLLSNMHLDVHFRDVTFETLNEPGFGEALRKAFPFVDWDKPFNEFNAAKEKSANGPEAPNDTSGL